MIQAITIQAIALPKVQSSGLKIEITKKLKTVQAKRRSSARSFSGSIQESRVFYITSNLQFGSQRSTSTLDVDTGSPDFWIVGSNANCTVTDPSEDFDFCKKFGTFDVKQSTTIVDTGLNFETVYSGGQGGKGELYQDDVEFGGVTIPSTIFGVASEVDAPNTGGILGLGFIGYEANGHGYTNFPANLVKQGLISGNFYSLFLDPNSDTGTILFGGIDLTKYVGDLVSVPLTTPNQTFFVNLDQISGPGFESRIEKFDALLDSGSITSVLPNAAVLNVVSLFKNPVFNNATGYYDVDCDSTIPSGDLTFRFGNATVGVPISSFYVAGLQTDDTCTVEIMPTPEYFGILGDNFMKWAYLVFNIDENKVEMAQAVVAS